MENIPILGDTITHNGRRGTIYKIVHAPNTKTLGIVRISWHNGPRWVRYTIAEVMSWSKRSLCYG